jgi:hypothetical protein
LGLRQTGIGYYYLFVACLSTGFDLQSRLRQTKSLARKARTAVLALSSTGGAVMQSLMALPCMPASLFLDARGCT